MHFSIYFSTIRIAMILILLSVSIEPHHLAGIHFRQNASVNECKIAHITQTLKLKHITYT